MNTRPSPRATLAFAALALFTVWITWRAKAFEMGSRWRQDGSALTGKPAPDFSLQSLGGGRVSLADYRGKTAVVAFWASWCGPCRTEMPVLARFYRQMHKPDSGFEFLAISIDEAEGPAQGAADTLKIPFPVLLDADSRVATAYGVDSIPMLFVIDKGGKVRYSHLGFNVGLDILLAQQLDIKNYVTVSRGNP
jgi:peroxiredoxin